MAQMDLRRQLIERDFLLIRLKHAVKEVKSMNGLLPICANGKVIRNEKGGMAATGNVYPGPVPCRIYP